MLIILNHPTSKVLTLFKKNCILSTTKIKSNSCTGIYWSYVLQSGPLQSW
ncbi:hypothetical protein RND71_019688 [Anisodus tanguticus]|uniref:Uncharacterized protein n=1 Tax=Anisodus tanguticus TaxID=243964 RepID=A0AAE1RZK8_9SOLA|nr:hypothetical protein RND71_019688 [Anisodus tanguticus]